MKQLTKSQVKELQVFLADYGLQVKAAPKPKTDKESIWTKRYNARRYKGISNAETKGAYNYFQGRMCPSNDPTDIKAWYENPQVRFDHECAVWQLRATQYHYSI